MSGAPAKTRMYSRQQHPLRVMTQCHTSHDQRAVVPTMAAIGNAIGDAIGVRPQSLPMSPPKLLELIEARDD